MRRDHDRSETELREMQEMLEALDGVMRRFATGDIRTTMDGPAMTRFEGLRCDFNRGIGTVSRSIDAILDSSEGLREDAQALRESLVTEAAAGQKISDVVVSLTSGAGSLERMAKDQAALARHGAKITENARRDMHIAQEAARLVEKSVKDICSEVNGVSSEKLVALQDKVEQVGRELAAMNIYLEAIDENLNKIAAEADRQTSAATALRKVLVKLREADARKSFDMVTTSNRLSMMERHLAEIQREAGRFNRITVIRPPSTDGPHGARSFLRLVKT